MPYGPIFFKDKRSLLSFEEIIRIVRAFSKLGVKKVRFTGGEPLIRRDFSSLLIETSEIDGICSLGLTTNGYYLNEFIETLLKVKKPLSVNVSLDTLKEDRFQKITGVDAFRKVTSNIELALKAGLNLKINTVVLKGVNDDEIPDIVIWSIERGVNEVRFIELMSFRPRGRRGRFSEDMRVKSNEIIDTLSKRFALTPIGEDGKAEKFSIRGFKTKVGIISADSDRGCVNCSKLRITPEGKLLFCLKSSLYFDLRLLLSLEDDEVMIEKLKEIILHKRYVRRERVISAYSMNIIGG